MTRKTSDKIGIDQKNIKSPFLRFDIPEFGETRRTEEQRNRRTEEQRNRGTAEQRNRGTENRGTEEQQEQRNRRTEEQRNRGTAEQKNSRTEEQKKCKNQAARSNTSFYNLLFSIVHCSTDLLFCCSSVLLFLWSNGQEKTPTLPSGFNH